jgi:hypothetical protein
MPVVKPEGVDLYSEKYEHCLENLDPFPEVLYSRLQMCNWIDQHASRSLTQK